LGVAGRAGGASRPGALRISVVLRLIVILILILTLVAIVVVVLLLAFTVAAVVVLGVSGVAFSRQQRERGQRDPTQRLQRIAAGRGIRVRANERVKAPVIHAFRPPE
jgi:uncharacterized protein (DUF58 family)